MKYPLEEIKKMLSEVGPNSVRMEEITECFGHGDYRPVPNLYDNTVYIGGKPFLYERLSFKKTDILLQYPEVVSDLVEEVERLEEAIRFALGPDKGCQWHEIQSILEKALETQRR